MAQIFEGLTTYYVSLCIISLWIHISFQAIQECRLRSSPLSAPQIQGYMHWFCKQVFTTHVFPFSNMATRNGNAADQVNVTLTAKQLKPPSLDWLVEYVHKELQGFKTLARCGLKRKVFQTLKKYLFILNCLARKHSAAGVIPFSSTRKWWRRNSR